MNRARILALCCILMAGPALAAEEVVPGLSEDRIEITANFSGSDLLIYGAVKRDAPAPTTGPLDVIITVQGPSSPVTVRRKARVAGIWVNTDSVAIDSAPSFYAIATTRPFADIISDTEDLRHSISIPRAIRSVGAPQTISDSQTFTEALIRLRRESGMYELHEGTVRLAQDTLFRTNIELPANLVEGVYKTRMFLVRGKKVDHALNILTFSPQKGAAIVKKVLESAIANAEHNNGADIDELKVAKIIVEKGPVLKRFTARAKGRGNRIIKPTCHVFVTVGDGKQ